MRNRHVLGIGMVRQSHQLAGRLHAHHPETQESKPAAEANRVRRFLRLNGCCGMCCVEGNRPARCPHNLLAPRSSNLIALVSLYPAPTASPSVTNYLNQARKKMEVGYREQQRRVQCSAPDKENPSTRA